MIQAGKVSDIHWSKGTWLILDIGFSNTKKSCGFLLGDSEAEQLQFSEAISKVTEYAKSESLLNLVIEAPLSVAFDKCGNPKSRSIDKQGGKSRPWYVGPGCAVMVAAMYLLKELFDCCPAAEIKLFEGFVSFKRREIRSSHTDDVKCLRDAIKQKDTQASRLYGPDELKEDSGDKIISAFKIMNLKNVELGIPAVVMIDKGENIDA
jgi:hypothetical protein